MPAIYYSKSANGFFTDAIHESIPGDKVAVPVDVWQRLITAQSPTAQLMADDGGNPILIDTTNGDAVIYTSVGQA